MSPSVTSQDFRHQFRRLVSQVAKSGGLVVSFRCALEFAKLDMSPEALAAGEPGTGTSYTVT